MKWTFAGFACSFVFINCASDHIGNPQECDFKDLPQRLAGADSVAWVCDKGDDGASGGPDDPLKTIEAALAGPAETVAVAVGDFAEAVQITRAVRIVGAGDGTRVLSPGWGVEVRASGEVTIEALRIDRAEGTGVALYGGRLDLSDVVISGTSADETAPGHGVFVRDGGQLNVRGGVIASSVARGLLVDDGSAELDGTTLTGNKGAVKVDGGHAALTSVSVLGNVGFGVAFVDASGDLTNVTIAGTTVDDDQLGGDGLFVASRAGDAETLSVTVSGGSITDNARFGVLGQAFAGAEVAGVDIGQNAGGGVWLQGEEASSRRCRFIDNAVNENTRIGLVATAGARVELAENSIEDTKGGRFIEADEVGDGLGIYSGADAQIMTNRIAGSARAGAVFDDSVAQFADNVVDEAELAVVVQAGALLEESNTEFAGAANQIVERAMGQELSVFTMPALLEPTVLEAR